MNVPSDSSVEQVRQVATGDQSADAASHANLDPSGSRFARQAVIIDDHAMIVDQLATLLRRIDPFLRILTADSLHRAIPLLRSNLVSNDLVFVDLGLGDAEGMEALDAVLSNAAGASVAVVSGRDEVDRIRLAFNKGASAFIPKSLSTDELVDALTAFVENGEFYPPKLLTPTDPDLAFKEREREIVAAVAAGLSNKEIAARLDLSPNTVKWYIAELCRRFSLKNRAALATYAIERGIIG
jgi:two-component system nitrate/nitrite response regulator NarL